MKYLKKINEGLSIEEEHYILHDILYKEDETKKELKKLIDSGFDVNHIFYGTEGSTALSIVASYHNFFGVEILLKAGADTEIKDGRGNRAIDYVNDSNILILFIGYGADITFKDGVTIRRNYEFFNKKDVQDLVIRKCPYAIPFLAKYNQIDDELRKEYDYLFDADDLGLI